MKRNLIGIGLAILIGAIYAYALPIKTKTCRLAGSNTPSGYLYWNIVDSTDTFEIDTMFSDSVNVDSAQRVVIQYYMDTIIPGTGAKLTNRWLIIETYTKTRDGNLARLLFTDSLGGTTATYKDTNFRHFASDTLLYDLMYFRSFFKDSVVATSNSAAGGKKLDTNYLKGFIEVIQRPI